jgi:aminoglycoside phosphotransferase (APT) family kinase protein
METLIRNFLLEQGWVQDNPEVSFLAAGEYNQNFLVRVGETRLVLRVNHGSQLGLADQIGYEYTVLTCVAPSGVTPLPYRVHPDREPLGGGAMLMQWLPGEALDYERDWERAAGIFACIHLLPSCPELLVQNDPVASIAAESLTLIDRYADHDLTRERDILRAEHERILELGLRYRSAFQADRLCMVNTEVNSGNFLITPQTAYLVDWEKAVVSSRYQDLAHFLAPTTTLWRTETIFSPEHRQRFLGAYRAGLDDAPPLDDVSRLCTIMEQVIVLRGLSWCFMAHHEYARGLKTLTSTLTRDKIRFYMRELTSLLALAARADQTGPRV